MADRKLIVEVVGETGSFERSLGRASSATNRFGRDFSRAERGVLAGSGVFRSLGRSLAFASGGFLAFGGAAAFLRKSVDAAKDAQVVNRQLAQQLRNDNKAFSDYARQIDDVTLKLSGLSGFNQDELKGSLTTILRTVPNVSKALRDLGTAADLARARHIALSQAALIIAKTEAGNTTLLRRQGFQIAKNATAEEALASLRAKVAGQARAGTTEQERFGAVLHDTEAIIGTALLPTLNKYLSEGARWLEQMDKSGKLQKDVAHAAADFAGAVNTVADIVKTVDSVTGGFKNTLELLLGLKIARWALGAAGGFRLLAASEGVAEGEALGLRAALLGVGAPEVLAGLAAAYAAVKLFQNATKKTTVAPQSFGPQVKVGESITQVQNDLTFFTSRGLTTSVMARTLANLNKQMKASGSVIATAAQVAKAQKAAADELAADSRITGGAGKHAALAVNAARRAAEAAQNAAAARGGLNLTAQQRNTFFDNQIARILLRGGLGNITQQIAALQKADGLIKSRMARTKDVTRRLNLEDELLQNAARIQSLRAQQTAAKVQAAADARQKAQDALQRAAAVRTSRQFRALGFTGTGDNVAPGVSRLRSELGTLQQGVQGTFLDTSKTQSVFARIRKVLSGQLGAVGRDVRVKIQEILSGFDKQLKDHAANSDSTAFRHENSNAILAGLGLSGDQARRLRSRIDQIGAGGSVPGSRSAAFVVHTHVNLDGREVARSTTRHQQKDARTRTSSRRG